MYKVILVTIAGAFMVVLDQTIMNVALPRIMAIFNETADRVQLVVLAYMLASAITTPAAAFLSQRFGMKRVVLLSEVGFLIGSVLCGLAWNLDVLIVFRVLQGLFGGILMTLTLAYLFSNVPNEKRGMAMAMFGIPMMLAPAIGPTLGGYLVDFISWRMVYYINIPVVIMGLMMGMRWMNETGINNSPFDIFGFILASIGFSSLLYAFSYAPTWQWDDWRIMTLLTVGSITLLIWIIFELRKSNPLLDLRIFRSAGYSIGVGLSLLTAFALFSLEFLLPLFLQTTRGLSAFHSGLMVLPQAIGCILALPFSGRLYDKAGPRTPVVLGLSIIALATLLMQTLDVTTSDEQLKWLLFFRGVGVGLSMMTVGTYALSCISQEMTAQGSAILSVFKMVFLALSTAVFATMLDAFQRNNYAVIAQTTTPDSIVVLRFISQVQVYFMQSGVAPADALSQTIALFYQYVELRSLVTAFQMEYVISGLVALAGLPFAFLLPLGRVKKVASAEAAVGI